MGRTQGDTNDRSPATNAMNTETGSPAGCVIRRVYTIPGASKVVDRQGACGRGHSTFSSIRLSQAFRPTLARSYHFPRIFTRTTSAVKSLLVPQTSHDESTHEPTP